MSAPPDDGVGGSCFVREVAIGIVGEDAGGAVLVVLVEQGCAVDVDLFDRVSGVVVDVVGGSVGEHQWDVAVGVPGVVGSGPACGGAGGSKTCGVVGGGGAVGSISTLRFLHPGSEHVELAPRRIRIEAVLDQPARRH